MNKRGREHKHLFQWPGPDQRRRLIVAFVWLSGLFVIVYGGSDWITSLRRARIPIHFDFELSLPFVPQLSLIYSSVYVMFGFIALTLHDASELRCFVRAMSCMTLAAGCCFLMFPAELAFPPQAVTGWSSAIFHAADRINLTYNCAPSLHVAYAVLCAETLRSRKVGAGAVFWIWAIAIALSAWLTYQHHLIDLITGCLLGSVTGCWVRQSDDQLRISWITRP